MDKLIPVEIIENKIYLIRGQKVMLDQDLAALYEVATKRLIEQVKRNLFRFPADFMFQLSKAEYGNLRSHFATSKQGGRRYRPFAFTENGVAMLSSVLNSKRAVRVNIEVMRTFTKLRRILSTHKELARRLDQLENNFGRKIKQHDVQISSIFKAIQQLLTPPDPPKKRIGFLVDRE